jgi:hypothetical protein
VTDEPPWIAIDGDEESLRAETLMRAYPEILREAVQDRSASIIEGRLCTRIFVRDAELRARLLEGLRSQLPDG